MSTECSTQLMNHPTLHHTIRWLTEFSLKKIAQIHTSQHVVLLKTALMKKQRATHI